MSHFNPLYGISSLETSELDIEESLRIILSIIDLECNPELDMLCE